MKNKVLSAVALAVFAVGGPVVPAQTNDEQFAFSIECEANASAEATMELKGPHQEVLQTWKVLTPATVAFNLNQWTPDDYQLFVSAPGYASCWVSIRFNPDSIIFGAEGVTLYRKRYAVMRYAVAAPGSMDLSTEKTQERTAAVSHWAQVSSLRGDWQIWQKGQDLYLEFHRFGPNFGFVKASQGTRVEDIAIAQGNDLYKTESIRAEPGLLLIARNHGNSAKDQCYAKIEILQITEQPPAGIEVVQGRE